MTLEGCRGHLGDKIELQRYRQICPDRKGQIWQYGDTGTKLQNIVHKRQNCPLGTIKRPQIELQQDATTLLQVKTRLSVHSIVYLNNGVTTGKQYRNHSLYTGRPTCVSNIHEPLLLTHCLPSYSASMASCCWWIRASGLLIAKRKLLVFRTTKTPASADAPPSSSY